MKCAVNGESDYPRGNRINQFDSFGDIVQALKRELLIDADLSMNRWIDVLFREFSNNLTQLMFKNDNGYVPYFTWVKPIRDKSPQNLNENYRITTEDGNKMGMFGSLGISMRFLSSKMIDGAIQSGVFIRYDAQSQKCVQGNVQKALMELGENIEFAKSVSTEITGNLIAKFVEKLRRDPVNEHTYIELNTSDTDILTIIHYMIVSIIFVN